MDQTETTAGRPHTDPERRQHHRLRAIFEEALDIVEPFFLPENQWSHHGLDHLAYRTLRERFPDMSFEEVRVLVVAAKRIFDARG